ncbi:MAG: ABC transporter permease [Chloroflexi bacterium]|nr:ABC transporter permease [Chloroflexota bacterium]
MAALFELSLNQLAGRRRLVLIIILSGLPVLLSILIVSFGDSQPDDFARFMLDGMIVAAVLPIVTMALATAAFGNELEDRTLSNIVLKPLPRWTIVLPKLLAVIAIGAPLLTASAVVSAFIGMEGDVRATTAVGVATLLGAITYSTVFTWAGLLTTRALGFALVYVFLWEGLLTSFLSGIRYLSVRGYTLAIMYGIDEDGLSALGDRAIQFPAAIVGSIAVTLIFAWLTVRRLRTMDVP